ncbi:MAG TPA: hypothetical protein V6D25_04655 [Leptolyngbyaceae cyanobacterium]
MSSTAISKVVKMMESLSVEIQEQIAEHLQEYISDLQDEAQWEKSFQKTQAKLVAAARHARQEIAQGKSVPMDYEQL